MPSTQSLSNWSLASDPPRQFCDQMSLISSDNIVQKGLACGRPLERYCPLISGAKGAPRCCPAGSIAEVGLRWCGATPRNRTEDLNVKVCKEATDGVSASRVPTTKSSRHSADDPEPKRADRGSKQSRVIALLQSPTGATIEAMMKATGWQQHSVRGFLAGVVRKRLKLKLGWKKVDGNRVYQIASADRDKTASPQPQRRPA